MPFNFIFHFVECGRVSVWRTNSPTALGLSASVTQWLTLRACVPFVTRMFTSALPGGGVLRTQKLGSPVLRLRCRRELPFWACSRSAYSFSCFVYCRTWCPSDFLFLSWFIRLQFLSPLPTSSNMCHERWVRPSRLIWRLVFRPYMIVAVDCGH